MKTILSLILALAAVILIAASIYTVDETEQVFITMFGKPIGEPINAESDKNEAGLHWKAPFIHKVNRIEKRILEWDGPATDMPTRDKLYIQVDTFARWRITDPITYYKKLRDERSALSRLDDIIGSATRDRVAAHDLIELVRNDKGRTPEKDESLVEGNTSIGVLPDIDYGRQVLTEQVLKASQPKVADWGIELIDVRFKRINYKSGVIQKIYSRMASERMQIAERFRSEGAGEAAKIIGKKERELLKIESLAYKREQEIRGSADAKATQIYANAYNTSPVAADFYQFMKTLETYEAALNKETSVILTSDSDLFRLFKGIDVEPAPKE